MGERRARLRPPEAGGSGRPAAAPLNFGEGAALRRRCPGAARPLARLSVGGGTGAGGRGKEEGTPPAKAAAGGVLWPWGARRDGGGDCVSRPLSRRVRGGGFPVSAFAAGAVIAARPEGLL